ncbi:MAG: stage V sporulation protein AD [Firmicutes bacterium]|nr:stage V sporulation protein AD [Bacillota bacterium]
MNHQRGKQSIVFSNRPYVVGAAAVGGVKEGMGPQRKWFDFLLEDDIFGEKTWEKAEGKMLKKAIDLALGDGRLPEKQVDLLLGGDLINQLMIANYAARDLQIPFLGLYGACSTMTESLIAGSVFIDGGYASNAVCAASSHYCTAERQFRMPLEHGNQRPPSAQWTATAAGSMVLSGRRSPGRTIRVAAATIGRVVDPGIKDVNQMGAAMAPAAVDTLLTHFRDLERSPQEYDVILSGDLGNIGKNILIDLMEKQGCPVADRYNDCGALMYNESQDVHSGGSGCGCSASIFAGRIIKEMRQGKIQRALIMSTGALLSTISAGQGESIPGIAHAVVLEAEGGL